MNFCRRCGNELTHVRDNMFSCDSGHTLFANSAPSTAVFLITENNQVLLARRAHEPRKGMLDAPGGFVDGEETFEQTIARELQEELGLSPDEYSKPVFLCSGMGHYPYAGEEVPVVTCAFWARLSPKARPKANDDVGSIVIKDIDDIDPDELHDDDIRQGLMALKNEFHKIAESKAIIY